MAGIDLPPPPKSTLNGSVVEHSEFQGQRVGIGMAVEVMMYCKGKIWDWNARGFQSAAPVSKFDVCVSTVGRQNVSFCVLKLSKNGCVPK